MNKKSLLDELNLKDGIKNICCFYSFSVLITFGEISSPHSHGPAGCQILVLHSKAPDPGCVSQDSSPSDNKNWSKWALGSPWANQSPSLDCWFIHMEKEQPFSPGMGKSEGDKYSTVKGQSLSHGESLLTE